MNLATMEGMQMKCFLFAFAASAALAASAAPEVGNIEIAGATLGKVRVKYSLSEDAVVTARFKVNGEWLSDEKVTALSGDVCRKVAATAPGVKRALSWQFRSEPWAADLAREPVDAEVELTAWSTNCPPQYMAINLESPYDVKYYVSSNAVPGGATGLVYKTTHMLMRKIPAAYVEFRMGTGKKEQGLDGDYNDLPHAAMLTKDFYIGIYEITQKQMQLMGGTRSAGGPKTDEDADILPSNGMTFNTMRGGAVEKPTSSSVIGTMAGRCGIASLDVPFEAQWEFACRGGTLRRAPGSSQTTQMHDEMWVSGNNDGKIHAVGTKKPNPYGLYDMLGNLFELCKDKFAPYVFTPGVTSVDPFVLTDGSNVTRRGGGYANSNAYGGCGVRVSGSPTAGGWDYGYRLCCDAAAY